MQLGLLGVLLLFPASAWGDSWLTSTRFHQAYLDVPEVERATYTGQLSDADAAFISDATKPLGVKAALVNAYYLSNRNSFHGNITDSNFEAMSQYLKKKYGSLKSKKISGDELACLAYLQAMETYLSPKKSLRLFKRALRKNRTSLMSEVLMALTVGQDSSTKGLTKLNKALANKELHLDVRIDALLTIRSYTGSERPPSPTARQRAYLPPIKRTATRPRKNKELLDLIHSGRVTQHCKGFKSAKNKHLSLCLEVRPEPDYRRRFAISLRDPSKLNNVKHHRLVSRWAIQNDIKADESVYWNQAQVIEVRDNFYLIWPPVLKGTAQDYDEAYSLLYYFEPSKGALVLANLDLACPSGCTSQSMNYQSMGGKTTVFYSTKVNGKSHRAKYNFDGQRLMPIAAP